MTQTAAAPAGLSVRGQTYVVTVALAAAVSFVADSQLAWVVLLVLALPLSLLAMWVGFYAVLALGALTGQGPEAVSWPGGVAWVAVWAATAWINARLAEKVLDRGWDALRTDPRADDAGDAGDAGEWDDEPDDRRRS